METAKFLEKRKSAIRAGASLDVSDYLSELGYKRHDISKAGYEFWYGNRGNVALVSEMYRPYNGVKDDGWETNEKKHEAFKAFWMSCKMTKVDAAKATTLFYTKIPDGSSHNEMMEDMDYWLSLPIELLAYVTPPASTAPCDKWGLGKNVELTLCNPRYDMVVCMDTTLPFVTAITAVLMGALERSAEDISIVIPACLSKDERRYIFYRVYKLFGSHPKYHDHIETCLLEAIKNATTHEI